MFLFDGGVMDEPTAARIRLPADELSDCRFVDLAEAAALLSSHMHRRIEATVDALRLRTTVYLEDCNRAIDG